MLTIEACTNGTITRACARALNRALGTAFSGSTLVDDVLAHVHTLGRDDVRVVGASSLTGQDKARHTREVTRSRNAQARRVERKAAEAAPRRPMPYPRAAA